MSHSTLTDSDLPLATLRAMVWPCSHKPPCSEAASRPDIVFTAADLAWFRKPLA